MKCEPINRYFYIELLNSIILLTTWQELLNIYTIIDVWILRILVIVSKTSWPSYYITILSSIYDTYVPNIGIIANASNINVSLIVPATVWDSFFFWKTFTYRKKKRHNISWYFRISNRAHRANAIDMGGGSVGREMATITCVRYTQMLQDMTLVYRQFRLVLM